MTYPWDKGVGDRDEGGECEEQETEHGGLAGFNVGQMTPSKQENFV